MNVQHILIPTDLSEEAIRPFEAIRDLARRWGAKVTLLHLVPRMMVTPHGAALAPRQEWPELTTEIDAARPKVEAQAEMLRDGSTEVSAAVAAADDCAESIDQFATQNNVDLIALSTHGRSGFRRLVLGSVAEGVLRHATVPVLCFPRASD